MMDLPKRSHLGAIALRAAVLFLIVAGVGITMLEIVSRGQIADRLRITKQASLSRLNLEHEIVHAALGSIVSDLLFLSQQNELQDYIKTGSAVAKEAVAAEYLAFAQQKAIYSQIRFLNSFGMETIRVDFENGAARVVPQDELEPKGSRYYFMRTFVLKAGQTYVSPFDLKVDQGTIREPRQPVIRFGTPIHDESGQRKGILLVTYLGENLFRALGLAVDATNRRTYLANWEGYWLWGPDPSVEWGFMYYGQGVHTVDESFPGAWESLATATAGQFELESGLFTFNTLNPLVSATRGTSLEHEDLSPTAVGNWKLISFVPTATLDEVTAPIRRLWRIAHACIVVGAAVLAWFVSRYRVLRSEYGARIEHLAKYDSLTNACNRHAFETALAAEEARARRYRHPVSFLMADITRFKQINDTYGHGVGDRVLIQVAAILKASVRTTDLVVRYGGDEFLIMFPETPREADVARQRILQTLDAFNASESEFDFPILLAMGSAQWDSTSGETIEDALSHADEKMYEHKQTQHASRESG